jgi:thiamine biosynthesis lipoprotein
MGTTWKLKVRTQQPLDPDKLIHSVATTIETSEKILSHWRPDAELYNINENLTDSPISVHPVLWEVLQDARKMHQKTRGAFDISITPLVNLWGFGPVEQTRKTLPSQKEIEYALTLVGMDLLELLPDGYIRKKLPALQLDLSCIAKGAIVDQVCEVLDQQGFQHYLVEIGGELRAKGNGASGSGWNVALEDGSDSARNHLTILSLKDAAVATSGTYRLFKANPDSSKNASHLLDPRTGRPVEHNLVAVNVIAQTTQDADVWATSLMVLGVEDGMRKAAEVGLAARFCILEGEQISYEFTPGFAERFLHAAK